VATTFKYKGSFDRTTTFLTNASQGKGIERIMLKYGEKGLKANTGDLLLFQMDNQVIAAAELEDVIPYQKPTIKGYHGSLVLNKKSIKVFRPISKEEMTRYIPIFTGFNQTKQKYYLSEVNIKELKERISNE
jgi:hypothetical protein